MEEITPQLYIADEDDVRDIQPENNDFDTIITVGYNRFKHRGEPPAASDTGSKYYFPDGEHSYDDFREAVDYTINRLEDGEKVLVHCQAGISRSAGVCSVALAETSDKSLAEALSAIEKERSIVNPAPEIRESMKRYTDETVLPEYGPNTELFDSKAGNDTDSDTQ